MEVKITGKIDEYKNIGSLAAEEILNKGGKEIVDGLNKNVVENEE